MNALSRTESAPEGGLLAGEVLAEFRPSLSETRVWGSGLFGEEGTRTSTPLSPYRDQASTVSWRETAEGPAAREVGEAGQLFYRARYYQPSIGRFSQEDPMRNTASMLRTYQYVGNSPMAATDPFGLFEIDASCKCPPWSTTPPDLGRASNGQPIQGPGIPGVEAGAAAACGYLKNPQCRRFVAANFGAGVTDCMFKACDGKVRIKCRKAPNPRYLGYTPGEAGPIWIYDTAAEETGGMGPTIFHEMFHLCGVTSESYGATQWRAKDVTFANAEKICSGANR